MGYSANGEGPAYSVDGESAGGLPAPGAEGTVLSIVSGAPAWAAASGPDATALPVAAVADWRLWTLAQGDTSVSNAANPGTYDLTANANAATAFGGTSARGRAFATMNTANRLIADRRQIAGATGLLPASFSVAAWFTLTAKPDTNECFVWMKRNDDTDWLAGVTGMLVDTSGRLKVQIGPSAQVTLTEYLPIGVPQIAAYTWNGTTRKVYLGGRLLLTDTPTPSNPTSGSWGLFGQAAAGTAATAAQDLPGLGDRVAVWDSVLTAAQVRTLADLTRYPWPTT